MEHIYALNNQERTLRELYWLHKQKRFSLDQCSRFMWLPYCFSDVAVKWPGSVHDSRIFLRSTVNNMLRNKVISKCEKVIVDDKISVPVCILGDFAYPLLLFIMKEYPTGEVKRLWKGFWLQAIKCKDCWWKCVWKTKR